MARYILIRLVAMIPTLFLVLLITFTLGYLGPVDPVKVMQQQQAAQGIFLSPQQVQELRHQYGLDRSFGEQFLSYVTNLARGNFGFSFYDYVPVWPRIETALPVSLQLAAGALLILVFVGVPLGVLAARHHNTRIDYTIVGGSLFLYSIPVYVLVPMTLIVTVLWLHLMEVPRGWRGVAHPSYFLAAWLLSLRALAGVIRQTRAGVLEVLQNDYVRTARAKGLRERQVVTRHILKNAIIPVVTYLGLLVDDLVTNAVFVDLAFNLPGIGRLFQTSLVSRDFNIIYAVVIFTALLTMIMNLIVDLLYPVLDPRVVYD
ncbi:MAG: ABC transporter permease [Anaerolineae bacterium]|nr:ABC transporter permease [Anaerolineae bacterium]